MNRKGADHSGHAVWGMNHLRPLKHWDRGFESHSRYVCLCVFMNEWIWKYAENRIKKLFNEVMVCITDDIADEIYYYIS
jgi:hypothetical protein